MATLITGAAGFVGSHLIELLEKDSAQIVGLLRPGTEPLVSGSRVIWHAVEMHDRDSVAKAIAAFAPSEIYHLAGVPHVGDSWSHVHETFAGNVLGTHHLFSALRRAQLKPRVLITSSAIRLRSRSQSRHHRRATPFGRTARTARASSRRKWSRCARGRTMGFRR